MQQAPARDGIEPQRRVVQHEQFRLRRQRHREAQARPLPAREMPGLHLRGQAKVGDHRLENILVPLGKVAGLKLAAFLHRHPAVDVMALGQIADARARLRPQVARVLAENAGPSARRVLQSQENADRGRLPHAVAAQKAVDRTARDLQVQVAHDLAGAIELGQMVDLDDGGGIHFFFLSSDVSTERVPR